MREACGYFCLERDEHSRLRSMVLPVRQMEKRGLEMAEKREYKELQNMHKQKENYTMNVDATPSGGGANDELYIGESSDDEDDDIEFITDIDSVAIAPSKRKRINKLKHRGHLDNTRMRLYNLNQLVRILQSFENTQKKAHYKLMRNLNNLHEIELQAQAKVANITTLLDNCNQAVLPKY